MNNIIKEDFLDDISDYCNSIISKKVPEKPIGEVYLDSYYDDKDWYKFYKNDLIDQIENHYKIAIKGHGSVWYTNEEVIIYEDIDPFNKILKKVKKEKENVKS